MLTREQIELAKQYNAWRRQTDDDEPRLEMPNPKAIGEAIDALVKHAEKSPVTADGVVVAYHDDLWHPDRTLPLRMKWCRPVVLYPDKRGPYPWGWYAYFEHDYCQPCVAHVSDCYSTQAAAAQARGE